MSLDAGTRNPLRVSIIGGGPGGLTLARILQETTTTTELHVTVYERDESRFARSQGGSLDLHDDTGLRALRAAGLIEEFKRLARPDGEHFRVYDKLGVLRLDHAPPMHTDLGNAIDACGRPEIDRQVSRPIVPSIFFSPSHGIGLICETCFSTR